MIDQNKIDMALAKIEEARFAAKILQHNNAVADVREKLKSKPLDNAGYMFDVLAKVFDGADDDKKVLFEEIENNLNILVAENIENLITIAKASKLIDTEEEK